MNKIIIIGNGFDLHHGLPTDYSSFLFWLLCEMFREAIEQHSSTNVLVEIKGALVHSGHNVEPIESEKHLAKWALDSNSGYLKNPNKVFLIKQKMMIFSMEFKSDFFEELFDHQSNLNWVDIEMTYYRHLKECLNGFNSNEAIKGIATERLKRINNELDYIKERLCNYLYIVTNGRKAKRDFIDSAKKSIDVKNIIDSHHIKRLQVEDFEKGTDSRYIKPMKVLFLSFNYTGISYSLRNGDNFQFIDIHGLLNEKVNKPIFGYGDEIDSDYFEMEKTNHNEFLTHIKSFGYFNSKNYQKLISFIESDSFVVSIWGHSCGLTDRTLLSMIFEHDNCAAIQPYYWSKPDGTDDYTQITQNISRHFKNKLKMRNRLMNKEVCVSLGSE